MIALRDFETVLSIFNTGELFDIPMIDFDLPGIQSIKSRFATAQFCDRALTW